MRGTLLCGALMFAACFAQAQDPLKMDPAHYKVEFENDRVRIVRVHFDPHYKSVMNQAPPRVVVVLTDEHFRVTYPDGTSASRDLKAGTAFWSDGGVGIPENVSDQPFELIWVVPKESPRPPRDGPITRSGP